MMEDTESQELDVSSLNLQPDANVNEPKKFVDSSEDNITTQQQNNMSGLAFHTRKVPDPIIVLRHVVLSDPEMIVEDQPLLHQQEN